MFKAMQTQYHYDALSDHNMLTTLMVNHMERLEKKIHVVIRMSSQKTWIFLKILKYIYKNKNRKPLNRLNRGF